MKDLRKMRINYLLTKLRTREGNQGVILAELIKSYNARPARRETDGRVQGWNYIQPNITKSTGAKGLRS